MVSKSAGALCARMMRPFVLLVGLLAIGATPRVARATTLLPLSAPIEAPTARWQPLPPYPDSLGVSAPFAGLAGRWLVVGGGCNFPGTPAADGGQKAFYATAYALDTRRPEAGWQRLPDLPAPAAYGATVSFAERASIYCLGGQNAGGTLRSAYCLRLKGATSSDLGAASSEMGATNAAMDAATAEARGAKVGDAGAQVPAAPAEQWECVALPPLPVPIDNGGAARVGDVIYIVGGNQPEGARGLYALDTRRPERGWQRLKDYPGPARIQPAVVGTPEGLYLIGGYHYDAAGRRCALATTMLRYAPQAGRWSQEAALPPSGAGREASFSGGAAALVGRYLVLTGGVDATIFRTAMEGHAPADYLRRPAAWYRFSSDVRLYDTERHTWQVVAGVTAAARAGAALVAGADELYLVGGECKPGIRTPEAGRLTLDVEPPLRHIRPTKGHDTDP